MSETPTPLVDKFVRSLSEPETDTRIPSELEWRIFARSLERRVAELEAGLLGAVEVIKGWHNMDGSDDVWQIYYDHSPEMKPIRALLEKKP